MSQKKYFLLIIMLLGVTLVVTGVSYAYFTAIANSDEQVVKSGVLELTYQTEQNILAQNIIPTEEENASIHKFTVENTGTLDANYNISFVDMSLTQNNMEVTSFNLKWALYLADSDYTEGTLVKEGNFSPSSGYLSGDDEFVIKTNMVLSPEESQSFILKVWLQETGKLQNEDQGLSLRLKMQVDTLEKQEPTGKQSVMRERNYNNSTETFYQYSDSITKVVFQNKMSPIPDATHSWDVSKNNDGNCMAYLVSNQEETDQTYTLYIQGNDKIYLSSGYYLFSELSKLITIEKIEYVDTSQVTNMSNMFNRCSSLTNIDLSHFDTSQVTNMLMMFNRCSSLTNLDVSHFDTSQITSMSSMFSECSNLTNLNLSNFDTSQVTDMNRMFYHCKSLVNLDVNHFDTSQVIDMSNMFWGCINLTSLNLRNFDTSNVTNMREMFYTCDSLTSLDLSHFNTSQVTNMYYMFNGCDNLRSLDISSFETSQVTDMGSMFANCNNLTNLDFRNAIFTAETEYSNMFDRASSSIRVIVKDATAQSWIQNALDTEGEGGTAIIAS